MNIGATRIVVLAFGLLPNVALGQALSIPSEVDYGASGLVQFQYRCAGTGSCRTRCYSRGTLIAERDGVTEVVMTAYRTHGRQNAPDYEIQINTRDAAANPPQTLHLFGEGACTMDGMTALRSSGFLSRTKRETNSR